MTTPGARDTGRSLIPFGCDEILPQPSSDTAVVRLRAILGDVSLALSILASTHRAKNMPRTEWHIICKQACGRISSGYFGSTAVSYSRKVSSVESMRPLGDSTAQVGFI